MNSTERPELVPFWMITSTLTLSLIGLFGNLMIVAASLVSRQLKGRCQLLIALLAAVDVIVCCYLVVLRILMFMDWYFVPNSSCFLVSVFGLFALNAQAAIGLVIGFDRLLAVLIPIKYPMLPPSLYYVFVGVIMLYSAILTFNGYLQSTGELSQKLYRTSYSDDPVPVCLPPTAYTNGARTVWIFASMLIAVLVLVVYGAANIKCRLLARTVTDVSLEKVRRLLSSMNLVMGIYFSTWFITVLMLVVTQMGIMSPAMIQIVNQQLAWLVIINASLNFFIYMWRSPEYRKTFLFILTGGKTANPNISSIARRSTIARQSIVAGRLSNKSLREGRTFSSC